MYKNMRFSPRHLSYWRFVFILSSFWISGLVIGGGLAFPLKVYSVPLMRTAVGIHVAVTGILFAYLLPGVVSLICPQRFRILIIVLIAFIKGICLGHSALAALWAWGNCLWPIFFLLSFSSLLTLIPLFCLWLQSEDAPQKKLRMLIILAVLIGMLDYFLISPCVLTL